jgi:Zn-dependent protease
MDTKEETMHAQNSLRIATVRGIEVRIHFSWLIAVVLMTWSLAEEWYPSVYAGWSQGAYYAAGAVSALLLFASVLLHEFGHSLTAQRFGVPVRSITLFIFGGVASMEREADRPRDEFWIAAMGPVVSAALAGLFLFLTFATRSVSEQVAAIALYLAIANGLLFAFNMIPGFPLDGGRVLRATVWALTGDQRRATTIASAVGQVVAYALIFWGVSRLFDGDLFGGLWTAFIGWFLANAAVEARQGEAVQDALAGATAGQLMRSPAPVVPPGITLADLVHRHMLRAGERAYLVADDDRLAGLITQTDVMKHRQEEWPATTVAAAMTPAADLRTVGPDTPVADAVRLLSAENLDQLPVVDRGRAVGLLSRAAIVGYLQLRLQLGAGTTPAPGARAGMPARVGATAR